MNHAPDLTYYRREEREMSIPWAESSDPPQYVPGVVPDTGCAAATLFLGGKPSKCISCPLPYGCPTVGWVKRHLRDGQVVALAQQGKTPAQIARELHIGETTAERAIRRGQIFVAK